MHKQLNEQLRRQDDKNAQNVMEWAGDCAEKLAKLQIAEMDLVYALAQKAPPELITLLSMKRQKKADACKQLIFKRLTRSKVTQGNTQI